MNTISTSGISPSSVIRADHLLRIIRALNGTTDNIIILSGSLSVTGSATFNSGITGSLQGTASYALTSSMTEAVRGSTGYIPIFTRNETLGNSNVFQDNYGRVGIGTNDIQKCAALEIKTKDPLGLLLPKLTTSQINEINGPVDGLLVYDTDIDRVLVYIMGDWKVFQFV